MRAYWNRFRMGGGCFYDRQARAEFFFMLFFGGIAAVGVGLYLLAMWILFYFSVG